MKGRVWTPADDDELRALWGRTLTEIGRIMGCSRERIRYHGKRLGLPWSHVRRGGAITIAWTGDMTEVAMSVLDDGGTLDDVAARLDVPRASVVYHLRKRGLIEHSCDSIAMPVSATVRDRRCMTCREWFLSTGPGNRMCDRCRLNADFDPMSPW